MICPRCKQQLRFNQRSRRRCALCHREFVFEPRRSKFRLHDMRVRRLDEKLSGGGRWRYTTRQLWYAASRKPLAEGPKRRLGTGRVGVVLSSTFGLVIAGFLIVGFVRVFIHEILGLGSGGSVRDVGLVFVVLIYLLLVFFYVLRRGAQQVMPIPVGAFRDLVINRWAEVYGRPPPNLVDEQAFTPPRVDRPRVAVVCPDVSVLACLAANGVSNTFDAALSTAEVPPNVPVVLLHDASPKGIRFAQRARAALPGRLVVDAGLHVRLVMARPTMLRRREPFWTKKRDLPVTAAERAWLRWGLWSPIAAIKPAKLVAGVTRAIRRAEVLADPESRQAERIGFLSWPAS